MKPSDILYPLSPEQVKFGRLVTNIWNPHTGFYDPPTSLFSTTSSVPYGPSSFSYESANPTTFFVQLSKFFGINCKDNSNVSVKIEAESTTTETVEDYSSAFQAIWPDRDQASDGQQTVPLDPTREWVQSRIQNGEDVYMVVEIKKAVKAKVTVEASSERVNAVDAGKGASALDLMIAWTAAPTCKVGETYTLNEECVIAVQYCKLQLDRWWNPQRKVKHGEVTWKWFVGPKRAMKTQPLGDDCIAGVMLGDPVTAVTLRDPNQDLSFERALVRDVEVLF